MLGVKGQHHKCLPKSWNAPGLIQRGDEQVKILNRRGLTEGLVNECYHVGSGARFLFPPHLTKTYT